MKRAVAISALSGALLAAAFSPAGFWPLAFITLAPLIYIIGSSSAQFSLKRSFAIGLAFGIAHFVCTVYWVINAMYFFGGVPFATGAGVMLLLAFYLALYPAIFAAGVARVMVARPSPVVALFFIPAFWVGLEYLRTTLFTGFPWVLVGYTQANFLPLLQTADLFGVWGVGFIIVFINAAIALFVIERKRERKAARLVALLGLALLTSSTLYGFMQMPRVKAAASAWKPLRVAVAQGSVDQAMKWDPDALLSTIDTYRELTLEGARAGVDLIVWPETAMPFYLAKDHNFGLVVKAIARESRAYLLTGSPHYEADGDIVKHYNSAFVISPDGVITDRYDKHHLVPFGEYVPIKRVLFFIKKLTVGVGDFSAGPGAKTVDAGSNRAGVLICFESIFPDIARSFMMSNAAYLVNITNDAWFGRTSAPYQHFDMAVMRAVEGRVFVIRSANTGISAVIDPTGRAFEKTGLFTKAAFTANIGLREGQPTFFVRMGWLFPILALGFAVIILARAAFVRKAE